MILIISTTKKNNIFPDSIWNWFCIENFNLQNHVVRFSNFGKGLSCNIFITIQCTFLYIDVKKCAIYPKSPDF